MTKRHDFTALLFLHPSKTCVFAQTSEMRLKKKKVFHTVVHTYSPGPESLVLPVAGLSEWGMGWVGD